MSGTPKRLHEEGGRPATSKHATEESNSFHSNHPGYHPSPHFESGQDGRLMKNTRTDGDKRSPLNSMYRLSSSLNDSGLDQQVGVENRIEVREAKESRDLKVENRDGKVETRDETQGGKGEKLARFDSRGDDSKEMKYHRQQIDSRDVSMGTLWKESKEQQRGKRFPEASGERGDMWLVSPCNVHVASEIGKEGPVDEVNEIVGENKVEFRGDDKMKDRERKKKDEKHREWGERDKDRNDRQSNLQTGNGVNEHREMTREERDERWERERKDAQKEKERPKDREKDHIKKEPLNAVEKESLHNEKELADGSVRIPEQESSALEQRRPKEFESWKSVDRDAKDRHKERDVEADRNEKRNRGNDKESDDAFVDGDGVERERDGFSHGVQQRKRMIRPRGSPQLANKERLRSRPRENEESEDKTEVSTVVYKVGECMQELIKLWKEFEASQDKSDEIPCNGPTLEIRIPSEYVTATNRQVRGGQLWGTDIYTDDSDLVAVLMHTGYCRPTASPPPPAIQELRATIRILPPQDCYTSTLRNNVRSRAWGAAIGCSYRVDRCCIIKKGGGSIDLEPCLTHTSSVEPTLAPVAVERTITTRAAASNALRQQKFMREVTIQYNLCNEPWIKYSINIVADKGLKKPLYTSARLKKGEVLYLETHSNRYELCFNGERMVGTTAQASEMDIDKSQNHNSHEQNGERSTADRETTIDVFRWSRCKMALPQNIMRSIGIPLPLEHITVLEDGLEWEDVQWSQTGVWIAGKEYALARVHFLSPN